MPTKTEQLSTILAELRKANGVEGSALISRDGIPVVVDLPKAYDRETFSAMTAAMLGAAETAMIEIGRGAPERVVVENNDYRLTASGVNGELMLVVLAKSGLDGAPWIARLKSTLDSVRKVVA